MTNDEKEYRRYEDYNKRYSDIYKGLKSYSDSKAKYILMISGVGILTILNILEKGMFKKEVLGIAFLLFLVIGSLSILDLILTVFAYEKGLEIETFIYEKDCSREVQIEKRNNNCYEKIIKVIDIISTVLLIILFMYIFSVSIIYFFKDFIE